MTRIVAISDLHVDHVTLGHARCDEITSAVWQSVHYAIDQKADVFMFLGDLADPDSGGGTIRAQELIIEAALHLAENKIRFVAIAGNHCVENDATGATVLGPLAAIERSKVRQGFIYVAEDPRLIELQEDLAVLCLPYTPVSRGVDMAEVTKRLWPKDPKVRVIVISHLTIPGIMPGEETTELPRGAEVSYPFAETTKALARISGHYHRRQAFDPQDGGQPIIVVGTPCVLTFGESDNEPSFLMLEF